MLAAVLLGAAVVLTLAGVGDTAGFPDWQALVLGRRTGRDRAPSGLVLRPPRARPVARRLDVPRGARRLQPHVRRGAPPGHDARGGGVLLPRPHRDGARLAPHAADPAAGDGRRAPRLDRARRDDPRGGGRARLRGRDHRASRRALADRDPARRVRARALARRPSPRDQGGPRAVVEGGLRHRGSPRRSPSPRASRARGSRSRRAGSSAWTETRPPACRSSCSCPRCSVPCC